MALTGIANTIVPLATISRTLTPTAKLYEDSTRTIIDYYATINAAVRLLKRITHTPEFSGGVWKIAVREFEYPANYDQTYDPTNLASATTAPFTLALGTQIGETTYTNPQVMLPTIYASAGDTLLT
jgi:hypothetical protein